MEHAYPVSNRLPIMVDLLVQKLEQSWRVELEIHHIGLFWRSRCFWGLRLADAKSFTEIGIDRIVSFTLSFWWFDPIVPDSYRWEI